MIVILFRRIKGRMRVQKYKTIRYNNVKIQVIDRINNLSKERCK